MDPKREFQLIGNAHDTDKTSHHGYHRFYPRYIKHLQLVDNMAMIEIGMDKLKSLNMWLEYFPKAFVYGVDIGVSGEGDRYLIHKADQSNVEELESLHKIIIKSGHQVRFINDDGSHVPDHIVVTFNYMFTNILAPGGVYIIEDIETSYWKNGTELYGHILNGHSAVDVFKRLVDDVNREFLSESGKNNQRAAVSEIQEITKLMISSITFAHNCIIIMKKSADEYDFSDKLYRWPDKIQ